ncbi:MULTISPECIES: YveK family protein [Enterococcus]|uniref:YveK family protein n=1 Tax=Enterococcus TaxID=1350 RepID=UPI0010F4497D|nr:MULTISPECIES: Wzz/FepE/Etk N-terminal domain-containing protein [Enterococcus]KAF1303532.1 tyrosine protein kinase [Enterococcus sp. JM9B]
MEETISLKEIFGILKKHIAAIIISMFAGLALAGAVTFFVITPKYSSQAQLIVTLPKNDTTNVNDVNTNLQMINTYKDLIVSDLVMSQVKDTLESEYDLNLSTGEIKGAIEVTQSQNSQMFSIKATSTKAVDAEHIANTTAQVFQESAKDTMTTSIDKISIISKATARLSPVSPNNKLNLAIGIVLGLMVGVGMAFLLELLDRTVKDDKFVTDTLGFTILGTVPQMTQKEISATTLQTNSVLSDNKKKDEDTSTSRRSRSRV